MNDYNQRQITINHKYITLLWQHFAKQHPKANQYCNLKYLRQRLWPHKEVSTSRKRLKTFFVLGGNLFPASFFILPHSSMNLLGKVRKTIFGGQGANRTIKENFLLLILLATQRCCCKIFDFFPWLCRRSKAIAIHLFIREQSPYKRHFPLVVKPIRFGQTTTFSTKVNN